MTTINILPPPDIAPTTAPTKFEREQAAFRQSLPELLQRYRAVRATDLP